MKASLILFLFAFLLLTMIACNISRAAPAGIATAAAQQTSFAQASSTATKLVPVTGGQAFPQVSVSVATNCRTGPGANYPLIMSIFPGQNVLVIGKYTPLKYWIISTPTGGACWLWGQYAAVNGDTSHLPEYSVPPLPTATITPTPLITPTQTGIPFQDLSPTASAVPPTAPSGLTQSRTCTSGSRGPAQFWIEEISLTWSDNADNETGYHVYENNTLLSDLPANTAQYQVSLRYNQKKGGKTPPGNLSISAYNDAGTSAAATIDIPRCP